MSALPSKTTVLLVVGGPAGSYAAAVLARHGVDVTILESAKFPRYHIGVSSRVNELFSRVYRCAPEGARAWFSQKTRCIVQTAQGLRWFVPFDPTLRVDVSTGNHALNVLQFAEAEADRPIAAEWKDAAGYAGNISFHCLIDAAGGGRELCPPSTTRIESSWKNNAIWAYWKGAELYGKWIDSEGAPFIESLHDHSGWAWYIPINDYTSFCEPWIASDFSYLANNVAAKNYHLGGEAAAFINPFFSNGVHLAFVGGLSAALSIIRELAQKPHEPHAAFGHCAKFPGFEGFVFGFWGVK
ncbi:hypothetical protein K438DRAFT_2064467 [Mycena galopus ATCC 62051]|nr:hypothetical protein K438DRAFT_2064467 [Mycena galopus ATCC 62051]